MKFHNFALSSEDITLVHYLENSVSTRKCYKNFIVSKFSNFELNLEDITLVHYLEKSDSTEELNKEFIVSTFSRSGAYPYLV